MVLNWRRISPPWDIWQCLQKCLVPTAGQVLLASPGRGQGCCSTSCGTQDGPRHKGSSVPKRGWCWDWKEDVAIGTPGGRYRGPCSSLPLHDVTLEKGSSFKISLYFKTGYLKMGVSWSPKDGYHGETPGSGPARGQALLMLHAAQIVPHRPCCACSRDQLWASPVVLLAYFKFHYRVAKIA